MPVYLNNSYKDKEGLAKQHGKRDFEPRATTLKLLNVVDFDKKKKFDELVVTHMVEYLQKYKEQWKVYDWPSLKELLFRLIVKELYCIEGQKGARKFAKQIEPHDQPDVSISLEKTTISDETTKTAPAKKGLSDRLQKILSDVP